MRKKSPVWAMPKEQFADLILRSESYLDVAEAFGYPRSGKNNTTLRRRCRQEGVDTSHFDKTKGLRDRVASVAKTLEEVLVANSSFSRHSLKKKLLRAGLLKNECCLCGLSGTWNGQPLVMVLDHINGVPDDNRLRNLRMVCPNCNSQLSTFSGRHRGQNKVNHCLDCGLKIAPSSTRCRKCYFKMLEGVPKLGKRKIQWPPMEELEKEIAETNRFAVSKRLGVSDTAVRKMLDRMKKPTLSRHFTGVVQR